MPRYEAWIMFLYSWPYMTLEFLLSPQGLNFSLLSTSKALSVVVLAVIKCIFYRQHSTFFTWDEEGEHLILTKFHEFCWIFNAATSDDERTLLWAKTREIPQVLRPCAKWNQDKHMGQDLVNDRNGRPSGLTIGQPASHFDRIKVGLHGLVWGHVGAWQCSARSVSPQSGAG